MANYLLIRSQVENFDKWKSSFDQHSSMREEAGLNVLHILHLEGAPNDVTILFSVKDLAKAKAFSGSAELRERMQESGVIGRPDVHFLHQ